MNLSSGKFNRLEQLQETLARYQKRQHSKNLIPRLERAVDSIWDRTQSQELESLADRFTQLNDRLAQINQSFDKFDSLDRLQGTIDRHLKLRQMAKLNDRISDTADAIRELTQSQDLEKLTETDSFTQLNDEFQTVNNQSSDRLNQLKQLQKTIDRYTESQQSLELYEQLDRTIKTVSPEPEKSFERTKTKYDELAEKTIAELGKLDQIRLDLEIYYRASFTDSKTDGQEILQHSNRYCQLALEDPQKAKNYLDAIAKLSSTYKQLPENTTNLDFWAKRLVNSYLAKQQLNLPRTNQQRQFELEL